MDSYFNDKIDGYQKYHLVTSGQVYPVYPEDWVVGGKTVIAGTGKLTAKMLGNFLSKSQAKKVASKTACSPISCFTAGTLIHTIHGLKPIESIEHGDLIWSRQEFGTEYGYRPVVATKATPNQDIYEVVVKHSNNTTETFKTTSEHPFWVEGIGWLKASLLEQGMTLLDKHGSANVTIIGQTKLDHTETVYNFEVQDFHTYHIGEYGVWVHNADCCVNQITSIVKQDELLLRESRKLSQQESQGINQMMEQIRKGNENPGIGTSVYHGITEFRHRNGGRIYVRKTPNGWEILAYSGK